MEAILMKYNPSFLSDDEIIKTFAVRHTQLSLLLETIRENDSLSNQHALIVGPRGSGKTTLVQRVAAEIRNDEHLATNWYPLAFAEESYSVSNPGEFWLEALFHLARQTGLERWQLTHRQLATEKDDNQLRERALSQLLDFADEHKQRILLIVENLDTLFGVQMSDEDAWVLRHTLMNEQRIMLLGTAKARFDEVSGYGKALFGQFRELTLEPLDTWECQSLWKQVSGQEISFNHVRPIQILTGGNPRLIHIIARFNAKSSFHDLLHNLTHLVDEHTEYFKSQLDRLAVQERKVYVALAGIWDPASARAVAEAARLDVNKASSLLQRLVKRGAVQTTGDKRHKLYFLSERMYNIYYLMRCRGGASERVRAVVQFMINFYDSEQLSDLIVSLLKEYSRNGQLRNRDLYEALIGLLKYALIDKSVRSKLTQRTQCELAATTAEHSETQDVPDYIHRLNSRLSSIEITGRLLELREKIDRWEWLCKKKETLTEIENTYQSRVGKSEASFWDLVEFAALLRILAKDEKRILATLSSAQLVSVNSYDLQLVLAFISRQLGQFRFAANLLNNLSQHPLADCVLHTVLGELYHYNLEQFENALQEYSKAIELQSDYFEAWHNLGKLHLYKLHDNAEAQSAFKNALAINPKSFESWTELGNAYLHSQNQQVNMLTAYMKAKELRPQNPVSWALVGFGQLRNDKFEDAEQSFVQSLNLNPEYPLSYIGFVVLNAIRSDWDSAIVSLEKLLTLVDWNNSSQSIYTNQIFAVLAVFFAVHGQAGVLINTLVASKAHNHLEPLIVGLRLHLAQHVNVAKEILEVGQDFANLIREIQKQGGALDFEHVRRDILNTLE